MKKKWIVIAAAAAVLALLVFILKGGGGSGGELRYKLAEVKRGSLENLVSSTGTLSALETVEVGSQVSGICEELHVDFNSRVKKGQLLATIDKTLFSVAVNDKKAALSRTRAVLNQARAEVERNKPLFKKGHLSESEFLVIQTDAEKAEADVEIALAALKKAETNLEYCEIRSPINGTVIERSIDEGQTIAASFQAPQLFLVAEDLNRMQIEAQVDESDIGQISENQEVRFTVQAYSEKTFNGRVRQIRLQPETIQNVVNYTVIVDAPNDKGLLLPGMTATVDFVVEHVRNVLLVPNKAFNFSPSREEMMKIVQKMRTGRPGPGRETGNRSDSGEPGGFKMPDDFGRVFSLNADNELQMMVIRRGVTDGISTELKAVIRGELPEGGFVITGIETIQKENKEKAAKNTLLPMPGRGRGPR